MNGITLLEPGKADGHSQTALSTAGPAASQGTWLELALYGTNGENIEETSSEAMVAHKDKKKKRWR